MRNLQGLVVSFAFIASVSAASGAGSSDKQRPPLAGATAGRTQSIRHVGHWRRAASVDRRVGDPITARSPDAADHHSVDTNSVALTTNPLTLGMKWNGNNDSAGQTRIENLHGGAVGTGAEVGLKLHF